MTLKSFPKLAVIGGLLMTPGRSLAGEEQAMQAVSRQDRTESRDQIQGKLLFHISRPSSGSGATPDNVRAKEELIEDRRIKQMTGQSMFDSPLVNSFRVEVMVHDDVATLSGDVDTCSARSAAARCARESGARPIHNHLRVPERLCN